MTPDTTLQRYLAAEGRKPGTKRYAVKQHTVRAHSRRTVHASDLRVGDTIEVWWSPGRDTITALTPYRGPLACMRGARIASFAILKSGMTLEPGSVETLVARQAVKS